MESLFGILKFIGICIEVLLIFNLLIIVHELGHFLAAKWRGAVIEGFGVWFGKPLWKKKINGVTYSLGSIPFGGFVKLPQLMDTNLEGESEYAGKDLPRLSAIDKIIVAFAGPLFSMLLAFCFAVLVWAIQRPVGEAEATTTIGMVQPDSPAAKAGLQKGDVILSVDGHPVTRFGGQSDDSVMWRIVRSEGDKIALQYKRGDKITDLQIDPGPPEPTKWYERRALRKIGIGPKSTPMVAKVEPGTAGDAAGLKPNDLIVGVNGQPIYDDDDIADYAQDHGSGKVVLDVDRGPEDKKERVQIPYEVRGVITASVVPESPASRAGLQPGDHIVTVDGKPYFSRQAFMTYIQNHAEKPVALEIERPESAPAPGKEAQPPFKKLTLTVKPEVPLEGGETRPGSPAKAAIGMGFDPDLGFALDMFGPRKLVRQGPVEQISLGINQIANTIGAIASKSSIGIQHMGGPVMMMRVYYNLFESPFGWRLALWFSVIINVNLALLNMLPIPPLDGSHITLGIVEMIRRKPVTGRLLEYIVTPFTLLVIGFMLFVTFFDVQDLFGKKAPTMRFKPAPAAQSPS